MMTSDVAVSLRPALAEDRFRIRRWLADPEIEAWWGNAASAEAEINLAMGSTAAVCRIVVTEGVPIGYAHAAEVGLWAAERPAELAPGMWQVACFVTPATDRGGSLVPRVLSQLTEEVFATTLAVACAALVSIRNEAGARAYQRAGFRWQRIWRDELLDPSWLMLKDRPK